MGAHVPILLQYQIDWVADRSPVKAGEKSRRVGLTWATALGAVLTASARVAKGGMDVYFMTYTEEGAKEFIRDCEKWAGAVGAMHGEVWVDEQDSAHLDSEGTRLKVKILTIEFPRTGFRIHALCGRPRAFRGKQGYAIIDEAAYVDDLAACMKAAMAFVMWGGRVALISTHCGEENEFNKIVCSIRDGEKKKWSLHTITLDKAIEQGLARRRARVTGQRYSEEWAAEWEADIRDFYGEDAGEELDCVPSREGAGYFDANLVAMCRTQLPVLRWAKPREWGELPKKEREAECDEWIADHLMPVIRSLNRQRGTVLGVDFARYTDGSVWVLGQLYHPSIQCAITIELSCIPLRQQEQILNALCRNAPRLARVQMDKTGNGFALFEWAAENFGRLIEGVDLSPKWHDESWPMLRGGLGERGVDIPDDDDCAGDFKFVQRVDGKPRVIKRRSRGKGGATRHGDFAVACALMYRASKLVGPQSGTSVGPGRRSTRRGL